MTHEFAALDEFLHERIDNKDRVSTKPLVKEAAKHFRRDSDLLAAMIYPVVYRRIMQIMSSSRQGGVVESSSGVISSAESLVVPKAERSVFGRKSKYRNWREWNGAEYVLFMRQTRQDCFAASAYRRQISSTHLVRAMVNEAIGEKLRDGEVVEDKFTEEDVEKLEVQVRASLGLEEESA